MAGDHSGVVTRKGNPNFEAELAESDRHLTYWRQRYAE